jgi:hypothetical protein
LESNYLFRHERPRLDDSGLTACGVSRACGLIGSFCAPIGLDLGGGDEDGVLSGSGLSVDLTLLRCNWSNMPEVVDLLVDRLNEPVDALTASTPTHVAEVRARGCYIMLCHVIFVVAHGGLCPG